MLLPVYFALAVGAALNQLPPCLPKPIPRIGIPRGEIPRDIGAHPDVKKVGTPPPTTITTEKK